jgi:uncharacterized membrane protein
MPVPLHPILVHFPIVLGFALPILALVALLRIGAGVKVPAAWLPVLLIALLTLVGGFVSVQSGEGEEEIVEKVVPHDAMEAHEGNGKRFMVIAAIAFVVALGGLAGRRVGGAARGLTVLVALLLAAQLLWTAKTGGALVYEHGAASAYSGDIPAVDPVGHDEGD